MTTTIDGRRFSRRETVTIEGPAELAERLPTIGFAKRMEIFTANACAFLERRDLPTETIVGTRRLDLEIAHRGFARDTPEDFAARIIMAHDDWKRSTGEHRDAAAFKLGELWTLVKVYGIESAAGSAGGAVADDEMNAWLCERYAVLRDEGWPPTRAYRKLARESKPPLSTDAVKKRIDRAKKVGT